MTSRTTYRDAAIVDRGEPAGFPERAPITHAAVSMVTLDDPDVVAYERETFARARLIHNVRAVVLWVVAFAVGAALVALSRMT